MELDTDASEVRLWGKGPGEDLRRTTDRLEFTLRGFHDDSRKVNFVAFKRHLVSLFVRSALELPYQNGSRYMATQQVVGLISLNMTRVPPHHPESWGVTFF